MQLIIDGGTRVDRDLEVANRFPASKYYYHILSPIKNTIPVASVRQLLAELATTSSLARLVWIQDADCLNIESGNTLLKSLEEPPGNTHFVLTTNNHRGLLPTILSRCTNLHLSATPQVQDTQLLASLKLVMGQGVAGRLSSSLAMGKDRESLSNYLLELLASLQATLTKTDSPKSLAILAQISTLAQDALVKLKQNGNVTLIRDHFFLSLPRTK
jgi:hypothetical protein